jgi:hypothetical protein
MMPSQGSLYAELVPGAIDKLAGETVMKRAPGFALAPTVAFSVALTLWRPACAVTTILPLTDLEPQYASQLCWAAADTIAVNSFFATSCTSGTTAGRTSQAVEAAYNELGIKSVASLPAANPATVSNMLNNCETNVQICNKAGNPILPGLTYKTTTGGNALSWSEATQQIDSGHPFLFVWDYPTASSGSKKPSGLHELIAIGYSDDAGEQQLVIWDPWPVPETLPVAVPACGPANIGVSVAALQSDHLKRIAFSLYVDPESDMGIMADHGSDQYDLAALKTPEPPPDVQVNSMGPQAPQPPSHGKPRKKRVVGVSFARALHDALTTHERTGILRSGEKVGTPFPIIGLGLDDLRRGSANPDSLLTRTTAVVLYPVESNGKVTDAFLMLFRDGHWVRGGYANTGITRLLVQARARYAKDHGLADRDFYMVSVPGRAAFFAGFGLGAKAVLIPASSDPSISATAGRAVSAELQLKRVADAIHRDDVPVARGKLPPRR